MQKQTVKTFESTLFGSLHTFTDDKGAPWFVGRQVVEKLGYNIANSSALAYTLRMYCPERKTVETLSNLLSVLPKGVRKNSSVISEGDLYKLVMSSKLEGAESFQNWVTTEVLPSIRNHGGYHVEQPTMAAQYADPELFAKINSTMADMGLTMANISAAIVNQSTMIATLVKEVADMKSGGNSGEDDVPMGYETRSRVWAKLRAGTGAGCMNASAFQRMLTNVSWPEVRFMRFNRDGLLVPVPYLKPVHRYKGEDITPGDLMLKIMRESMQVTNHKFTHPLIGDYLQ